MLKITITITEESDDIGSLSIDTEDDTTATRVERNIHAGLIEVIAKRLNICGGQDEKITH